MHQIRLVLILIILIFSCFIVKSQAVDQTYADTLVHTGQYEDLSKYLTFWIDTAGAGNIQTAGKALAEAKFIHWPIGTTLNAGLNPKSLWLYLNLKNGQGISKTYWWSLYSHADSVKIFQKTDNHWLLKDSLWFAQPINERKVKTRFLASEIFLESDSSIQLLMRIRNLHNPQYAFTDLSEPKFNLLWEKDFYWKIGFFIGAFLIVMVFNLVFGVLTKERMFFYYALYILIVAIVTLHEELLLAMYPGGWLFQIIHRTPAMGLIIIGCAIHFWVIDYVINPEPQQPVKKIIKLLHILNIAGLVYGSIFSILVITFRNQLDFGIAIYRWGWWIGVQVIALMMLILFLRIVLSIQTRKYAHAIVIAAFYMVYFNAAGYYLNYEGIINYYTITYPNYFFWALSGEFVVFALILAGRYRQTLKRNFALNQEKLRHRAELLEQEVAVQERERNQIARDLHDDLGATINALKLVITNSYQEDKQLLGMATQASNNLRFFLKNFSNKNMENGLFQAVAALIKDMKSLGKTDFRLEMNGDEKRIPEDVSMAIYRIIAELVTNILKHAEATEAHLQLVIDEQILIMAEDNGKGFDTETQSAGLGLENLNQRTARYGGEVHITSHPQSGTTTIITIPLPV